MPDILRIHRVKITLTEAQIMYGIEEVGLPHPVIAYKTVDTWRKGQLCLFKILKINK
jgi:hypothetical protein